VRAAATAESALGEGGGAIAHDFARDGDRESVSLEAKEGTPAVRVAPEGWPARPPLSVTLIYPKPRWRAVNEASVRLVIAGPQSRLGA